MLRVTTTPGRQSGLRYQTPKRGTALPLHSPERAGEPAGGSLRAAQRVIWRAWRHMEDREVADRLLDLVADEPVAGGRFTARTLLRWLVPGFTPAELRGALLAGLFIGVVSGITVGSVAAIIYVFDGDPAGAVLGVLMAAALLGLLGALVTAMFLGLLASLIGALIGGLLGALVTGPLGGGAGAIAGGLVGSLGAALDGLQGDRQAWHYRRWFEWWPRRPHTRELVEAIRQVSHSRRAAEPDWDEAIRSLAAIAEEPLSPEALVGGLSQPAWSERLAARYGLVVRGGETMPALRALLRECRRGQQESVLQLMRDIAVDTRVLAPRAHRLVCPRCLARCQQHWIGVPFDLPVTYYGCRLCHRSRDLLEAATLIAVLDRTMRGELLVRGDRLEVNALAHGESFDFDEVEVRDATDEEVERFLLRMAGASCVRRRRRRRTTHCLVWRGCRLSENSLRVLRQAMREVVVR